MNTIAVLTPSYRPDFEGFARLHRSVLEFTDDSVVHHVIVPRADREMFRTLKSSRLKIWIVDDLLPAGFVATDAWAAHVRRVAFLPDRAAFSAVNLRRPWPPVRGWIMQQLMKLAVSTRLDADAAVIIDSDVVILRRMTADLFIRDDIVRFYSKPQAVTCGMDRHVQWTRAAHRLLGLPAPEGDAHPDHIAGITTWDPALVAACLQRVEEVAAAPWFRTITSELHFSECILYGTFVRHFATERQRSFTEPTTLCHSYWDPVPLTEARAGQFIADFGPTDIAVHIQSNSVTGEEVTRHVLDALRAEARR
ncbi:DUF6492 family protein [Arthrobacter oryzae]|uniref:DUF6492 family protein n=1 Tax=Arthrobacter oryzae TaxID=409290 RepID=UPI0030C9A669